MATTMNERQLEDANLGMLTGGCLQVDANKKMLTWEQNFKGDAGCGNAKRGNASKGNFEWP